MLHLFTTDITDDQKIYHWISRNGSQWCEWDWKTYISSSPGKVSSVEVEHESHVSGFSLNVVMKGYIPGTTTFSDDLYYIRGKSHLDHLSINWDSEILLGNYPGLGFEDGHGEPQISIEANASGDIVHIVFVSDSPDGDGRSVRHIWGNPDLSNWQDEVIETYADGRDFSGRHADVYVDHSNETIYAVWGELNGSSNDKVLISYIKP